VPPVGSRGKALCQGGESPPEADDILLIQTPYFTFNFIDESVTLSN